MIRDPVSGSPNASVKTSPWSVHASPANSRASACRRTASRSCTIRTTQSAGRGSDGYGTSRRSVAGRDHGLLSSPSGVQFDRLAFDPVKPEQRDLAKRQRGVLVADVCRDSARCTGRGPVCHHRVRAAAGVHGGGWLACAVRRRQRRARPRRRAGRHLLYHSAHPGHRSRLRPGRRDTRGPGGLAGHAPVAGVAGARANRGRWIVRPIDRYDADRQRRAGLRV